MTGKAVFLKSSLQGSFFFLAGSLLGQPALQDFFYNSPTETKTVGRISEQTKSQIDELSFFSLIEQNDERHDQDSLKRAASEFIDRDGIAKDIGAALGFLLFKLSLKRKTKADNSSDNAPHTSSCASSLHEIKNQKVEKKKKKRRLFPRFGQLSGLGLFSASSLLLLHDARKAYIDKNFDPEEDWLSKQADKRNGRLIAPELLPEDANYLESLENLWLGSLSSQLSSFINQNQLSNISFAVSIPEWKSADLFEATPTQGLIVFSRNNSKQNSPLLFIKIRPDGSGWKLGSVMSSEHLSPVNRQKFFSSFHLEEAKVKVHSKTFWKNFRSQSPELAFESFSTHE